MKKNMVYVALLGLILGHYSPSRAGPVMGNQQISANSSWGPDWANGSVSGPLITQQMSAGIWTSANPDPQPGNIGTFNVNVSASGMFYLIPPAIRSRIHKHRKWALPCEPTTFIPNPGATAGRSFTSTRHCNSRVAATVAFGSIQNLEITPVGSRAISVLLAACLQMSMWTSKRIIGPEKGHDRNGSRTGMRISTPRVSLRRRISPSCPSQ